MVKTNAWDPPYCNTFAVASSGRLVGLRRGDEWFMDILDLTEGAKEVFQVILPIRAVRTMGAESGEAQNDLIGGEAQGGS
jgi:hypothetical protein